MTYLTKKDQELLVHIFLNKFKIDSMKDQKIFLTINFYRSISRLKALRLIDIKGINKKDSRKRIYELTKLGLVVSYELSGRKRPHIFYEILTAY